MTEWPPVDPADAAAVADRREEVLAALEDHAGQIAYQVARLQGGDYGQATVETDRAEWTLSYEAGDLEYLRYDPARGSEVYVVSTQRPPESTDLARALTDYPAFVRGFEAFVESRRGALDDVSTDFPEVASTDGVVAERDRVLDRIRDVCDRIARQLRRYEGGEYGTYTARVAGTRWELKYDEDSASYLRVGGSEGVYLLSQYQPPSAADIREYAPRFSAFVETYNDHVADLEADLAGVEL